MVRPQNRIRNLTLESVIDLNDDLQVHVQYQAECHPPEPESRDTPAFPAYAIIHNVIVIGVDFYCHRTEETIEFKPEADYGVIRVIQSIIDEGDRLYDAQLEDEALEHCDASDSEL